MKQILTFLLPIFFVAQAYAQHEDFEMYYPENPLFKKLRVKSVTDTIASPAFHHYKKEYDTLGRQTSWCYIEDSVTTRFKYVKTGDTLTKFHYYTVGSVKHEIYQFETFIYNGLGKILRYQNCGINYENDRTSECNVDRFFYDENNRLTTKLIYTNPRYNAHFTQNLKLADSLLNLTAVYFYQYDKNGKLITIKEMIGQPENRSTDSLFYEKSGRIIKKVRRQARGFSGEFIVNNIYSVKTFRYAKNRQTEITSITYSDSEINKPPVTTEEVNEYIFYPNGLKWMWYHKPDYGSNSRLNYLLYEFYK